MATKAKLSKTQNEALCASHEGYKAQHTTGVQAYAVARSAWIEKRILTVDALALAITKVNSKKKVTKNITALSEELKDLAETSTNFFVDSKNVWEKIVSYAKSILSEDAVKTILGK